MRILRGGESAAGSSQAQRRTGVLACVSPFIYSFAMEARRSGGLRSGGTNAPSLLKLRRADATGWHAGTIFVKAGKISARLHKTAEIVHGTLSSARSPYNQDMRPRVHYAITAAAGA